MWQNPSPVLAKIGDTVAIFAQGPIGLCATVGARVAGAGLVIAVESIPERQEMSLRMGADIVLDHTKVDVTAEIKKQTDGRGVDIAIEALGHPKTFENALRTLRPGGTLSSLGVYESNLQMSADTKSWRKENMYESPEPQLMKPLMTFKTVQPSWLVVLVSQASLKS